MKKKITFIFCLATSMIFAQKSNIQINVENQIKNMEGTGITADGANNSVHITTTIIYNALPDGYHITYTKSFINKSVEEVEKTMHDETDKLVGDVKKAGISSENALVDIVALEPIFDFNIVDSIAATPIGYKITENITFNVKKISLVRELAKKCLEYKLYDMVSAEAYLNNSAPIYDSLSMKALEFINKKKKLCVDLGWIFDDGKPSFSKSSEVHYPSDRYLKSYINSQSVYKHHLAENSNITYTRSVNADKYFNLNLKDADYVFNAKETNPVIQFQYQINYGYVKRDREKEKEEKERHEQEKNDERNKEKSFYILGKDGELKKVDMMK
jgi:hypothetical protein